MSKTLTLEGDLATVDVLARLTTQGSVVAPSLVTPAGAKKIDKIFVAGAAEGVADGSGAFLLRIGGNAVKNGEQTIFISAQGRIVFQTGSDQAPSVTNAYIVNDADIEVAGSDTIQVSAEMTGQDLGTGRVAVSLVFA